MASLRLMTGLIGVCAALMLSACGAGDSAPTRTPPPTQALNTAVPTHTATDAPPPTVTVTFPPSAAEFVQTESAQHTAEAPATPTGTPVDPVAQELAALAAGRFAREEGFDPDAIRVVEIESVMWPDATLGCGTPVPTPNGVTAAPGIPGYRIRVQVRPAGAAATYHADFIRIIRCDES